MLNFFHSLVEKVAVAISSIFLVFSGTVVTSNSNTQQATQDATSSIQVTQQDSATSTESSEIEALKKEIEALKNRPTVGQNKPTSPPKSIPIQATKPIEQNTPPVTQPALPLKDINLEVSNVRAIPSSHEISIMWNTNVPSNGEVTLWPTNTVTGNIIVNTSNTTNHQVKIATVAGKTYYYLIESNTQGGQTAASEQKEFTTPVDNVDSVINSVEVSRQQNGSSLDFVIHTNEPTKVSLQYNYHTNIDEAGAFTTISTDDFVDSSQLSVRLPADGWLPYSSVITFKITAYDQSLNSSLLFKSTTKIADITVK